MTQPHQLVAIVNMPFAPPDLPSIQVGLLKALLEKEGISSHDFYFNIDFFIEMKKLSLHKIYNSTMPSLISEWIFSPLPFNKGDIKNLEYITRLRYFSHSAGIKYESLIHLKNNVVPKFIEDIYREVNWEKYKIVAFTMTYAQINSSFRLASLIKKNHPQIRTIFGGATSQIHFDSAYEYMKFYPFIDYIVLGEMEPVLGKLVKFILNEEEKKVNSISGVLFRENNKIKGENIVNYLSDMSQYISPNYTTYFDKINNLKSEYRIYFKRYIPIEMSRGCVWGNKKPCNFCAFYPYGAFRIRPPKGIVQEMQKQYEKHKTKNFYILDSAVTPKMIEDIFPKIIKEFRKVSIPFIELRTNLKENHIKMLKEAGVFLAQPGIECFENGLLIKINKGVNLYQNINLMKWCRQYGIRLSYNILLGIPNATSKEIKNQLRIIKKIPHLDPPYPMPIAVVRFSNYWKNPEEFSIKNMKPEGFYSQIYPKELNLEKICFEHSYQIPITPLEASLYRETIAYIEKWQRLWKNPKNLPYLWYIREDKMIVDRRDIHTPSKKYMLDSLTSSIIDLCIEKPVNIPFIVSKTNASSDEILRKLMPLVDKDIILEEKGLFYLLAPLGKN